MSDDLNLIAGFASMVNRDSVAQNQKMVQPSESEILKPVHVGAVAPNHAPPSAEQSGSIHAVPTVAPNINSSGTFDDGFGELVIPPAVLAGRPQNRPAPHHTHHQSPETVPVFTPDLQSVIFRNLITLSKNNDKLVKMCMEMRDEIKKLNK